MEKVKVIDLNEDMEKALTNVCDAALRHQGLSGLATVNKIATAIRNPEEQDDREEASK